jgi:hypothetical protein
MRTTPYAPAGSSGWDFFLFTKSHPVISYRLQSHIWYILLEDSQCSWGLRRLNNADEPPHFFMPKSQAGINSYIVLDGQIGLLRLYIGKNPHSYMLHFRSS